MGEKVGIRVAGYRLAKAIGMSAMGSVFRATVEVGGKSLPMNSVVAVDLLHPRLRTVSEFLRRFHREAKIAARQYQMGINAGNKAIEDLADTPSGKGFSNLVAEGTGRLRGVQGTGAAGQEAERRKALIHHKGLRLNMKQWQTFMDSDLHSKVAPSKNRPLCCPGLTFEIQLTDGSASALRCKPIGGVDRDFFSKPTHEGNPSLIRSRTSRRAGTFSSCGVCREPRVTEGPAAGPNSRRVRRTEEIEW